MSNTQRCQSLSRRKAGSQGTKNSRTGSAPSKLSDSSQNQPQQCAPTWSCALSSSSERDEQVSPPDRTAGHDVRPATGIPVVTYTIQPRMPLAPARWEIRPGAPVAFPATHVVRATHPRAAARCCSVQPAPSSPEYIPRERPRAASGVTTDRHGRCAGRRMGPRRSAVPARISGRRKPPARDPGCHSRSDLGVHKALQCSPSVGS